MPNKRQQTFQSIPTQTSRDPGRLVRRVLVGALLGLTAMPVVATGSCKGRELPLPNTVTQTVSPGRPTYVSVKLRADQFLLVEAQATIQGTARPDVRLLDKQCRELKGPGELKRLQGRRVLWVEHEATVHVEVRSSSGSQTIVLDLWTDSTTKVLPVAKNDEEPSPVPPVPIDEYDELRSRGCGCRSVTKSDEEPSPVPEVPIDEYDELRSNGCGRRGVTKSDDEPDPVPPVPIDEYDELRTDRSRSECGSRNVWELDGLGMAWMSDGGPRVRSWCPWATRVSLLSTFSCARQVRAEGEMTLTLERPAMERDDMLRLELEQPAGLGVRGADGLTVYDSAGQLAGSESGRWSQGTYFVQVHEPDSVYELSVTP